MKIRLEVACVAFLSAICEGYRASPLISRGPSILRHTSEGRRERPFYNSLQPPAPQRYHFQHVRAPGGQSYQEQPYQEQPYEEQPYRQQSYQEQQYQERPYEGQQYGGHPYLEQPYKDQELNIGTFPLNPIPKFDNPDHTQTPEDFDPTENVGLDVDYLVPTDKSLEDREKVLDSIPDVIDRFPDDVDFSQIENEQEIQEGDKHAHDPHSDTKGGGKPIEDQHDLEDYEDEPVTEKVDHTQEDSINDESFEPMEEKPTDAPLDLPIDESDNTLLDAPIDEPQSAVSIGYVDTQISDIYQLPNIEETSDKELIRPQRQPELAQFYDQPAPQKPSIVEEPDYIKQRQTSRPVRRPSRPQEFPLDNRVISPPGFQYQQLQGSATEFRGSETELLGSATEVHGEYLSEDDVPLEEDIEEEEDKPDRLALLLRNSSFTCMDKKDGYYADELLQCEVFHFCQDKVKHSWLCPNGASFHQVHLICMPRTEDNICEKSSKFHFVNDFLYKEVSSDASGFNKTYADRYYPEGFTDGFANSSGVVIENIEDTVGDGGFQQNLYRPQYEQVIHQKHASRPHSSQLPLHQSNINRRYRP